MKGRELIRHDCRQVCIHEGGHTFVARALGYHAHYRIEPTEMGDQYTCAYVGKTHFHSANIEDAHYRWICLAGAIAVAFDRDRDIDTMDLADALPEELSETDAQGAGEYTDDDVAVTLELVRQSWSEIEHETRLRVSAEDLA